jgi:surface antigen
MESVIDIAKKYVGQMEKPNNGGFVDALFEAKMKATGWQIGWAWCASFAKLCFKEAGKDIKVFNPSALETFKNAQKYNVPISDKPDVGSVVIFQHGNSWQGHTGIVTEVVDEKHFKTIEGNTNNDGSREGNAVCEKTRVMVTGTNGLNVKGFIVI